MKIIAIAAAGLAMLTGAAPAVAQHTVVHERTVVRDHGVHHARSRRVCRTTYRHHHRVRTCRMVRY